MNILINIITILIVAITLLSYEVYTYIRVLKLKEKSIEIMQNTINTYVKREEKTRMIIGEQDRELRRLIGIIKGEKPDNYWGSDRFNDN